jgi:ABC-type cobalamin/Fe3+-siderophores transport system ATPase subunit
MLEIQEFCFHPILHRICLSFKPGSIHGILGPNGSGKTTFLKLIKKIWLPTQGNIYWNGSPLHEKPLEAISQVMSLVPQNPQVTFGFTVKEFIEMGCYPKHTSPTLNDVIELMDLSPLAGNPMTELSGGEKQRAYIARSMITEAPIMLLDEPTANLDIQHQQTIWKILEELAQKGKTVIIATHDLYAAKKHCQSVAIFCKGHCLKQGTFEQALTPQNLKEVFGVDKY